MIGAVAATPSSTQQQQQQRQSENVPLLPSTTNNDTTTNYRQPLALPAARINLSNNPLVTSTPALKTNTSSYNPSFSIASSQQPVSRTRLVITHMVLKDFKSYAGVQLIGPFHKSFTAVVGPNGSGKSNVIDALLFVFGYRASKMRQSKIGNLVHHSDAFPHIQQCSVEVHFHEILETPTETTPVPDTALVVSRTATKSHTSRYYLNAKSSNYTEVTDLLKSRGIDLDHNRFLILQGEVESIAQMKSKGQSEHDEGLLEYLEDIIGTKYLKTPIDEASTELDALQERRNEKVARVRLVDQELARLESPKNQSEMYLQTEVKRRRLLAQVARQNQSKLNQNKKAYQASLGEATSTVESMDLEFNSEQQLIKQKEISHDLSHARSLVDQARALLDPLETEVGELANQDVQLREMRKSSKKKRTKLESQRAKAEKDFQSGEMKLSELDVEMKRIDSERTRVSEELETVGTQVDELQVEVRFRTRDLQAELDSLVSELRPWVHKVRASESRRTAVGTEHDHCVDKIQRAAAALDKLVTTHARLDAEHSDLTVGLESNDSEMHILSARVEELRSQVQAVTGQLDAARAQACAAGIRSAEIRRALAQSQDLGSVLSTLKSRKKDHWPGLKDRLGNLGTISAKYDVAVSTAVGMLDHIVVDSVPTAQKCLEYLRTQRLGRANLICMDKVANYTIRPLQTPENVPRLFDLISFKDPKDESIRQAFYHAMRDTLVANDLNQAKRIAFSGRQRFRVVTLSGDLIDVVGTMAGGGGRVSRGRMQLSDPSSKKGKDADEDVTEDDAVAMEQAHQSTQSTVNQLTREVNDLQVQLSAAEHELCNREKQHSRLTQALDQIAKSMAEVDVDINKFHASEGKNNKSGKESGSSSKKQVADLKQEIDTLDAELLVLKAKVGELESAVASKQAEIDDVGGDEYKKAKRTLSGLITKADELTKLSAKTQAQIRQTQKHVNQAKSILDNSAHEDEQLVKTIQDLAEKLDAITARAAEIIQQRDQVQEDVDKAMQRVNELVSQQDQMEAVMQQYVKMRAELITTIDSLMKKMAHADHQLAIWAGKVTELQEAADQTRLTLGMSSRGQDDPIPATLGVSAEYDVGDVDDADDSNEEFNEQEAHQVIKQLETKLSEMVGTNLTVLKEYRARQIEHAERTKDVTEIEQLRDAAKHDLDLKKRTRLTQFMAGFTEVSGRLKVMYSLITTGGNAELELVDSMDPFSEGIIFSVMPPKKSWKQISNLSGGERTLASLALVFALQAYRPTPLYVLDEIDAALDFRNVSIIANYIREQSMGVHAAQFIIISLRHNMFELADRLVGIYKTHHCTKSVTINPNQIAAAVGLPES